MTADRAFESNWRAGSRHMILLEVLYLGANHSILRRDTAAGAYHKVVSFQFNLILGSHLLQSRFPVLDNSNA